MRRAGDILDAKGRDHVVNTRVEEWTSQHESRPQEGQKVELLESWKNISRLCGVVTRGKCL